MKQDFSALQNLLKNLLKSKSKKNTSYATTSQLKSPAHVSGDIDSVLSNIPQEIFTN